MKKGITIGRLVCYLLFIFIVAVAIVVIPRPIEGYWKDIQPKHPGAGYEYAITKFSGGRIDAYYRGTSPRHVGNYERVGWNQYLLLFDNFQSTQRMQVGWCRVTVLHPDFEWYFLRDFHFSYNEETMRISLTNRPRAYAPNQGSASSP